MGDLEDALAILGLEHLADAETVRRQYRRRLKAVHPDRGGDSAGVRRVVGAYHLVVAAALEDSAPASPAPSERGPDPGEVTVVATSEEDEGVVLDIPAEQLFHRLREALDAIGRVTFADADLGVLQAVVQHGSVPCQLGVTLHRSAEHTAVEFTLDSLVGHQAPPIAALVRRVADLAGVAPT